MGDMNDVESSATYRRVTEYGFNDALKVAGESYIGTGATFHHFGESLDNPRIDFFFTDQSLTINNYHVVDKTFDNVYPSNHFPIVIDIEE